MWKIENQVYEKKEHCWGGKIHSENTPIQLRTKKSQYQLEEQNPLEYIERRNQGVQKDYTTQALEFSHAFVLLLFLFAELCENTEDWAGDPKVLLVVKNSSQNTIIIIITSVLELHTHSLYVAIVKYSVFSLVLTRPCVCARFACSQDKKDLNFTRSSRAVWSRRLLMKN